jgi:hypothetical protein
MPIPVLRKPVAVVAILALMGLAAPPAAGTPSDQFMAENDAAMARMHAAMEITPTGDVDRDFVAMMIPHHQGGIDMAVAVLRHSRNDRVRRLAQEIIVEQQQEIVALRLAFGAPSPAALPAAPHPPSPPPAGSPSAHPHGG